MKAPTNNSNDAPGNPRNGSDPTSDTLSSRRASSHSASICQNEDTEWDEMFNRLVAFREKYGHYLVPHDFLDDRQLGSWVSTQRRQFKLLTSGSRESTSMTPKRASRLVSIGFEWLPKDTSYSPWENRYIELKRFVSQHGHAQVPSGWEENVPLSNWVSTQRQDYKNILRGPKRLTSERIKLLNDVGFVWEPKRGGARKIKKPKLPPIIAHAGPGVILPQQQAARTQQQALINQQQTPTNQQHTPANQPTLFQRAEQRPGILSLADVRSIQRRLVEQSIGELASAGQLLVASLNQQNLVLAQHPPVLDPDVLLERALANQQENVVDPWSHLASWIYQRSGGLARSFFPVVPQLPPITATSGVLNDTQLLLNALLAGSLADANPPVRSPTEARLWPTASSQSPNIPELPRQANQIEAQKRTGADRKPSAAASRGMEPERTMLLVGTSVPHASHLGGWNLGHATAATNELSASVGGQIRSENTDVLQGPVLLGAQKLNEGSRQPEPTAKRPPERQIAPSGNNEESIPSRAAARRIVMHQNIQFAEGKQRRTAERAIPEECTSNPGKFAAGQPSNSAPHQPGVAKKRAAEAPTAKRPPTSGERSCVESKNKAADDPEIALLALCSGNMQPYGTEQRKKKRRKCAGSKK